MLQGAHQPSLPGTGKHCVYMPMPSFCDLAYPFTCASRVSHARVVSHVRDGAMSASISAPHTGPAIVVLEAPGSGTRRQIILKVRSGRLAFGINHLVENDKPSRRELLSNHPSLSACETPCCESCYAPQSSAGSIRAMSLHLDGSWGCADGESRRAALQGTEWIDELHA